MPKVQITETYKYGSNASDLTNFTAYIPVRGIEGEEEDNSIKKPITITTEPTLYKSYKDLVYANYYDENKDIVDYTKPKLYDDQEKNYLLIRKLLEKGLPVLVEGVKDIYAFTSYDSQNVKLADGEVNVLGKYYFTHTEEEEQVTRGFYKVIVTKNDVAEFVGMIFYIEDNAAIDSEKYALYTLEVGDTYPTSTGMTVTLTNEKPEIDFDILADKALYNIRFLTLGTYNNDKDTIQKMLKCAAFRKDAIALVDHPQDLSSITIDPIYANVSKQTGKVRTYFEKLIKYTDDSGEKTLSNEIVKNGAGFTPWFKANLNSIVKEGTLVEDKTINIRVPASFGYLSAFITAVKQNPEYFAMAGSFRGIISELTAVDYNYSSAEVEILQGRSRDKVVELDSLEDNLGLGINPISKILPFGYLINGNRTLYVNDFREDNRPNYRAILSIRNLVCSLVKQAYFSSKKYTFEPNSDITYINFKSEITPTLDKMRSGLGIRGYKFTRLQTDAKARIRALISIKPIEPVEDFDLNVELDDSIDITE